MERKTEGRAAERVDVLAVMDEFALYVRNVSSRHALRGDIAEARAAVVHLMAAAEAVTSNPDMTTVRGRMEMSRRLSNLRAALAPFQTGGAK